MQQDRQVYRLQGLRRSGGSCYSGPGGPVYAGPGGACYDGPGGHVTRDLAVRGATPRRPTLCRSGGPVTQVLVDQPMLVPVEPATTVQAGHGTQVQAVPRMQVPADDASTVRADHAIRARRSGCLSRRVLRVSFCALVMSRSSSCRVSDSASSGEAGAPQNNRMKLTGLARRAGSACSLSRC